MVANSKRVAAAAAAAAAAAGTDVGKEPAAVASEKPFTKQRPARKRKAQADSTTSTATTSAITSASTPASTPASAETDQHAASLSFQRLEAPQKKQKKRGKGAKTAAEKEGALKVDHGIGAQLEEVAVVGIKDDEERELEDLVFGADVEGRFEDVLPKIGHEYEDVVDEDAAWLGGAPALDDDELASGALGDDSGSDADATFFFDTTGGDADGAGAEEDSTHVTIDAGNNEISSELPAAWQDDDDVPVNIVDTKRLRKLRTDYSETTLSGKEYEARLRKQFQRIHPTPHWAEIVVRDQKNGNSSDDLLRVLRTSMGIVDKNRSSRVLNPDSLEVVRLKDANQTAYSQSVIKSVQFHPKAPVLLTAGFDKTLRLFQVDGKVNPKIQSIYIKDLPMSKATFTPDGREILISGNRKFFYTYNIEAGVVTRIAGIRGQDEENYSKFYVSPDNKLIVFAGRDGTLMVVANDTKQWIGNMKMNGTVRSVDFSADGRFLLSFGGDGEVYQWDLGSRTCVHKFYDEGCVNAATLAVSRGSGFIATGSQAGVVNLYDQSSCFASTNPSPQKAILNLTTPITNLRFNHDSQILAMASREAKDSLRLLHVPTKRVFKNWPTAQTPLGYVQSLDFSPGGGYLAIGNDKGKVLLYRLNAYDAV
ncbi:U3 snoRNP protein [Thoreauomyces humboldtii]|nr:U3 snoRNP protein [Thoreauomyces humboldtii]